MPPEGRDDPPHKPLSKEGGQGREVLFEFTALGGSVKVSAVDVETGVEVSIIGPAHAAPKELQRVALQKLHFRLNQPHGNAAPKDKEPPPGGSGPKGGIIV